MPQSPKIVPLFRIVALAAAYYYLGRWGLNFNSVSGFAAVVWAPTGLSLAALLIFGKQLWPGVVLGAFWVNIDHGASLPLALAVTLGNTLEVLVGFHLLRFVRFQRNLARLRDVFYLLVLAAGFSTLISATIGTSAIWLGNTSATFSYLNTWLTWWSADALSNLIVAPLLLVWAASTFKEKFAWSYLIESLVITASLALVTDLVFSRAISADYQKIAMPYLVFPPLICAALRLGTRGAVTGNFITCLIALIYTQAGKGPFGFQWPHEYEFSLQLFMGVVAVTSLVFSAMVTERQESREALRRSHETLEQKVQQRTQELQAVNALLRDSEERFRLLVEGVEDYAIYRLDVTGHVLTWNAGAQRTKGYRADEVIGKHFSLFYTPADIQLGTPSKLLRAAAEEGHSRSEGLRVRKDGSTFYADVVISPIRDRNGIVQGFTKITRDITDRKHLDERLRKSQEQLTEAQRIAHLGSWEWDIEKNMMWWSDELYRIHGLPVQGQHMLYSDVIRFVHPEDRQRIKATLRNAREKHQAFSADFRIVRGDHEERVLRAFGNVVDNAAGQAIRMLGTAQDITEQSKAERILQQKEEELFQARKLEAIGRLAGGVAHDFNNLITGILGISQDLHATFSVRDPRRAEIEEVIKASNRAFDVTRQLLAFSRRQIISPKVIDINATITDFTKLLHRLIGEDIHLETELSDTSHVKIDPGNLGQILLNLTLNARDAMPQGGSITLRTTNALFSLDGREVPAVLLEVTDTGRGMDPDTLSHIFEPFFTTKTKDKGTGLGLATVYGIVKQSGGDITVESQQGQGTTFRIYLPREAPPEGAERTPGRPAPPTQGHETILVIEDEDIVRRVVVKRLQQSGYQVLEATTGEEALDLFAKKAPGIQMVITDVVMPGMNGRQVIHRIREQYPHICVLYMSGYPEEIIARRGTLEAGINFIEKSAIQKNLLKKVREVLDSAAKVKEPLV